MDSVWFATVRDLLKRQQQQQQQQLNHLELPRRLDETPLGRLPVAARHGRELVERHVPAQFALVDGGGRLRRDVHREAVRRRQRRRPHVVRRAGP